MELLKKDVMFYWDNDCQKSLDTLKEKLVTMPILVSPDWKKEFYVHLDASYITLRAILTQPGARDINHPIAFASQKLSKAERNYSTIEHEALAIVYSL